MEIPVKETPAFPFRRSSLAANLEFATKRMSVASIAFSTTLLLVMAAPLCAQQPMSLADAALRGQIIFDQSAITGMVLVVVRNREVMIKGYGETFPGSGRTPDSNSQLRLCSISKVFTGDLLTRLSAAGTVSLSDPLQRFAPPRVTVPQGPDGTPVTLEDLALHTSGLPREVLPSPAKVPHFTFPSYATRWSWLPKQKLTTTPGVAALYSNIGFDLLGDALATASHESYAQLLHETLLQPLGMWDTTLVPSQQQCARLLQPSKDQGPCTETLASGASSGVYSTAADMVKLLRYLLRVPGSVAQPAGALAVYLKPAQLKSVQGLNHAGNPTGIGLGWVQLGDPDTPSAIMQKTGGGAGFSTYIALSPSRQTGVFLAATWGKGDATIDFFHEANNLLAALANVPPLPPKARLAPAARKHSKRRRPSTAPARSPN
jgi:D-alanyl-D-alanine-carboxypeptidase/D-alanyl-D-alanine-endopeptidase